MLKLFNYRYYPLTPTPINLNPITYKPNHLNPHALAFTPLNTHPCYNCEF
jgi:hypothetical protein